LADLTPPEAYIVIALCPMSEHRYIASEPGTAVLCLGDWEASMAPPSIVEFIGTLVLRLATAFVAPSFLDSRHLGTKGCLFDFTIPLREVKFKIFEGYVCQQCREALLADGRPDLAPDLEKALSREWLGRTTTPGTPAHILKKLGYDLFVTKGLKPSFWEGALSSLQKDGVKEFIKLIFAIVAAVLGAFLLVRLRLK
jgi:hypothetical protein